MSYHTGTAATIADLRAAVISACVSEGWTWDSVAEILYKGTMFNKLTYTTTRSSASHDALILEGRTALTGGDIPDNYVMITEFSDWLWVYPLTYHIAIFTNEVWIAVNIAPGRYMHMAFGQSQQPGLSGTGNYFAATFGNASVETSITSTVISVATPIFAATSFYYPVARNYFCHDGLHGTNGWRPDDNVAGSSNTTNLVGLKSVDGLILNQPNAYNQESILVPMRICHSFLASKYCMVLELENCRYIRNDHYDDEQIIEIGPDKWKIFPFSYKNTVDRVNYLATTGNLRSGTHAVAIRYEEPI